MILYSRGLRIGFNSLCAFASVNHLHFHVLYVNYQLPIDKVVCTLFATTCKCCIYSLQYCPPISCFYRANKSSLAVWKKRTYPLSLATLLLLLFMFHFIICTVNFFWLFYISLLYEGIHCTLVQLVSWSDFLLNLLIVGIFYQIVTFLI